MSKKYTKAGAIWRSKKDPNKMFITLGDKSEKYGFNTQVAVFKGSKDNPEVLAKQENGILSVMTPKSEKAPENLVAEIFIIENEEE